MNSYLISWKSNSENPELGEPEDTLSEVAQIIKRDGEAVIPWRFKKRNNIQEGERVFLIRQGKKGYAILGYGIISSIPPRSIQHVPIRLQGLTNPRSEFVFAVHRELKDITNERLPWATQISGITLEPHIAEALEELVVGRTPIRDEELPSTPKNPNWTRDELILALDIYFEFPEARGNKVHLECIKLSKTLNSLSLHSRSKENKTFRNPNGVAMKLSNFLRLDPSHSGTGLSGGSHLEQEVWDAYSSDIKRLRAVAAAILEGSQIIDNKTINLPGPYEDEYEAEEGKILTKLHQTRERNRTLSERKKNQTLKTTGKLACEACGFDFSRQYGKLGEGFAECHHGKPVHLIQFGEKTKLKDLHILCSNCHRMIHRSKKYLSVEDLQSRIRKATQ